jgi:hypothetical protein
MVDNSVFALLILVAAFFIWAHVGLTCSYLKRAHPSVWTALGEPSLKSSSIGSARVWRFIWLDHAKIDDLRLRAYVVSGQVLQVLALAVLFALVVVNWQMGES